MIAVLGRGCPKPLFFTVNLAPTLGVNFSVGAVPRWVLILSFRECVLLENAYSY